MGVGSGLELGRLKLREPLKRSGRTRAARGFTLIELLLVLALAALLTGLVAPRVWQWVQGARVRAGIDSARSQLEALPGRAFASAQRIDVDAKGPLVLPSGWQFEFAAPLVYEANGMTAGGRVRISGADRTLLVDWMVEPPAGTVRSAQPADGPFRTVAVP